MAYSLLLGRSEDICSCRYKMSGQLSLSIVDELFFRKLAAVRSFVAAFS